MDNKRQEEMRCCCSPKEDSLLHPDPDPETERMIAEKEAKNSVQDELLIDAMKSACSLLEEAAGEARRSLMSPGRMSDLLRSASELLNTIAYLHVRISAQKTTDKLRLMREVEQRNDESIKRWAENEALHEATHGNEGARCARHGHCAGAECE